MQVEFSFDVISIMILAPASGMNCQLEEYQVANLKDKMTKCWGRFTNFC